MYSFREGIMPSIKKRSSSSKRILKPRRKITKSVIATRKRSTIAKKRVIRVKSRIARKPAIKKTISKKPIVKKKVSKKIVIKKSKPKINYIDKKTLTPMAMIFVKFKKNTPLKILQAPIRTKHLCEAWSWAGEWDCGYLLDVTRSSDLRKVLNKTLKRSAWVDKIKTKWIEKCW